MMFKKATFSMTYIGEIFTQILVLPYVGKELNMIIMLPDENVALETVRHAGQEPDGEIGGTVSGRRPRSPP